MIEGDWKDFGGNLDSLVTDLVTFHVIADIGSNTCTVDRLPERSIEQVAGEIGLPGYRFYTEGDAINLSTDLKEDQVYDLIDFTNHRQTR